MSEPRRDRAAARQVSRPISREAVTDEVSLFVLRKRRTHCPQSPPCHCEPVRTLVWQSVFPFRLPLQLEPADAGLRVGIAGAMDETRSIPLSPFTSLSRLRRPREGDRAAVEGVNVLGGPCSIQRAADSRPYGLTTHDSAGDREGRPYVLS